MGLARREDATSCPCRGRKKEARLETMAFMRAGKAIYFLLLPSNISTFHDLATETWLNGKEVSDHVASTILVIVRTTE